VRTYRGGARVGLAFDGQMGPPSVVNCCKFIRVAYAVSYICIHRVFSSSNKSFCDNRIDLSPLTAAQALADNFSRRPRLRLRVEGLS
jgi:hypothetical protein